MSNELLETAFTQNSDGKIITFGQEFSPTYQEWTDWHEEGYRFRTFSFDGVEPVFGDGAEIEVKGFGRTPVQADISEVQGPNFFWEQPMDEGLTLLRLGVDKQVHTYRISPEDLGKKMAVIVPGMLMCWFDEKDVNKVSRIRECEYPGFEEKELVTVTYRAREIQGIEIPDIFWDEFDRLNSPS